MGLAIQPADNQGNCGRTVALPAGFTTLWAKIADGGHPPDLLKRRVLLIPEGQLTGFGITDISPSDGPATGDTWVKIAGIGLPHGGTHIFFDLTQSQHPDLGPPMCPSGTIRLRPSPARSMD